MFQDIFSIVFIYALTVLPVQILYYNSKKRKKMKFLKILIEVYRIILTVVLGIFVVVCSFLFSFAPVILAAMFKDATYLGCYFVVVPVILSVVFYVKNKIDDSED